MARVVPDYAVAVVPTPLRKRLLIAALGTAVILAALLLIGWLAFGMRITAAPVISVSDPEFVIAADGLAARRMLESTATYRNTTGGPIWVEGYSADAVAFTTEVRRPDNTRWSELAPGLLCDNGVRWLVIAPGESHSFKVPWWRADDPAAEVRVTLAYVTTAPGSSAQPPTYNHVHSAPVCLRAFTRRRTRS